MQKKETWIFLTSILLFLVESVNSDDCNRKGCNCYDYGELEFQCPPRDYNNIIIHTKPGKHIEIDCRGLTEFDVNLLPDYYIGDVDQFSFNYCPLPNHNFIPTMEILNISKIGYLHIQKAMANSEKNVTKDLFDGLSDLEMLTFNVGDMYKDSILFNTDFLQNLPNLIQLYLEENRIPEIQYNMFSYTPKLQVLHLSRNSIIRLPDGLFKNLLHLHQLHLWSNELTSLSNETFVGLKQLKSLELSNNRIIYLDEDVFLELAELRNLSLRSNNLNFISSRIFRNNSLLEGIRFGNNPNLNLSDYTFANLVKLKIVNIDSSNLESLPAHIFEGSYNLVELSLKNNRFKRLPENVFKNLTALKKLDLSGNRLTSLPDKIFHSLQNLEVLCLEENLLTKINEHLFTNMPSLRYLNLRNNSISDIDLRAFTELKKLISLNLSANQYKLQYISDGTDLNPFTPCNELEDLDLSYNLIDTFPEDILLNKVNLKSLNLNDNYISSVRVASLLGVSQYKVEVYLKNNNISLVDFFEIKTVALADPKIDGGKYSTVVFISNNPIRCDCINYDLIQYSNRKIGPAQRLVDIRIEDLRCNSPELFEHKLVKDLKPFEISCPLQDKGCPEKCSCVFRPYDVCAVVDCSGRNLTEPPRMDLKTKKLLHIEVHLEENSLEVAPYSGLGYDNVTRLFLSNNSINNLSWIPPNIQKLDLRGNQLKTIDSKMIRILNSTSTLKNLTLYENPWTCGCSSFSLQNYLRSHYRTVNPNDVVCEDKKRLIEKKDLCKSYMAITMAIVMPILIIVCMAAVVTALYLYYQQEIKVWLYAKNLCLWFVTEEDLDKDKPYDIFISYSHKDEEFVIQNLLPVLESGPNPFKICIHVRDWVPGEFIATQVTKSVLDSKRTLVVLSESFLESVWGKMEFRTAHTQAINEGRARVVVIKYGQVDEEKLDDELKMYLKTNTYVEWGDPWFWNKLKYALPHFRKNNFYNNNQKHANIMLKIDDKFELVTSAPSMHVESTPPVISLDPSLLKSHPLNFSSSENIATPPAEAPLMIKK